MKYFMLFLTALLTWSASTAQNLPKVGYIHWREHERVDFVRIGQFQIDIPYDVDTVTLLPTVRDPKAHLQRIDRCLEIAGENQLQLLVFPELAMALEPETRTQLTERLQKFSAQHEAIIIAGTYYDTLHRSRCVTILPDGTHLSYKIRPSIFEASALSGKGMIGAVHCISFVPGMAIL